MLFDALLFLTNAAWSSTFCCLIPICLAANAILNDWAPLELGGVLLSMQIPPNMVKVLVENGVSGMMIAKGWLDLDIAIVYLFEKKNCSEILEDIS